MGMVVANNISSLFAWRNLQKTDQAMTKSLERLSTGLRINRAADDAAGLAISEKMRAQIRGLNQAVRNAQDGISLIQTAEGAQNEIHNILQRMRELANQASSETVTNDDRAEIQKEIDALKTELDRIATATEFNNIKLLNGQATATANPANATVSGASASLTIGSNTYTDGQSVPDSDLESAVRLSAGSTTKSGVYKVDVTRFAEAATLGGLAAATIQAGALTINGQTVTISDTDTLATVVSKINNLTNKTGVQAEDQSGKLVLTTTQVGSSATISVSADDNSLLRALGLVDSTDTTSTVISDAGTDAVGTINGKTAVGVGNTLTLESPSDDADGLSVNLTTISGSGTLTFNAVVQTDSRITLQIGANNSDEQRLELDLQDLRTSALGLQNLTVTDSASAQQAMSVLDAAISKVSSERAKLGAYQNRLEHTIANLQVQAENMSAAESRIRDVDMAAEMANLTRQQVLMQAGTAMLAQANSQPQAILQLLR